MKLYYSKYHFSGNDYYNNFCKLVIDNKFDIKDKNNSFSYIGSNEYIFDIQFFIFDNLTKMGNKYLDSIFECLYTDYLDEKYWKDYLLQEIKNNSQKQINNKMDTPHYYASKKYYEISNKIEFTNSPKQIKELNDKINSIFKNKTYHEEMIEAQQQTAEAYDEVGLIHAFFNLIFLEKSNLRIQKCKECERYYITTSKNKVKYCNRKYNSEFTCLEFHKLLKTDYIKELEKKIRDKVKDNPSKFPYFPKFRKNLKLECGTNVSKYVSTLIEVYYKTIDGKRNVIKDINLEQFLDKEYLEKIGYEEYLNKIGYKENE